tara:strand:+ start:431 stop:2737 length:2307 start_codon:yes stop_codon:yes gene_type:complete
MPLINTSVPNLIQGVSQQPDATRFASQCEEQENALSSVAEGLKKRPNTRHLARLLTSAISSNAKVHFINRTQDERYVAIHDGTLRIFNLASGVEATITDNTSSSGYLTAGITNPREDLDLLTVADYTFVLNKNKTVESLTDTTDPISLRPYFFVKQGAYTTNYTINIDGNGYGMQTLDTTTGNPNSNDSSVVRNRFTNHTQIHTVTAPIGNNGLYADSDATSASTQDGLGDTGLGMVHREVGYISDLPTFCINNHKVKISGDSDLNQDDYYVKFQTAGGASAGQGSWEETSGGSISKGIDTSTMPHRLVNTALDEFSLNLCNLDERQAGDNDSNPHPSFVDKKIQSIFFFKNRLGFVSNDSVVMSEAGYFFNFYRTTVSSLLDSAPIDVTVASTKVTNLKSAIGFQGNLVIFADNQQFILRGGDILTPKTISISAATSFDSEDSVKPLALGSYIYFPFTRGNYTGVRELSVDSNTNNYDAAEITEHVPSYVPKDIIAMSGTSSEDMIALLSNDEKGSLYIYNYFWNNNQKVLSAWSKFTFTGEIRGIEFIESSLYAVIVNNGETNLVEMPLESGLTDAAGYVTHLDMRVASTVSNGSSTITLPYTPADNSVEVYTTDGLKLNATNSGATVTLAQAVTADTTVFTGIPYTMKYTFSEQLFKAKAGNGTSPSNAAKMRIRNGSINFANSAYFKVKVTPKHRDTYENVFTPDVVGSSVIGSLTLGSGFYRFPVFTKPQDTTITIENESALPSTFQSAEFESFVHSRSNRYG